MESSPEQLFFEELIAKGEKPNDAFRIRRSDFGYLLSLPEPVKAAWDFYFEHVEAADWGIARLYEVPLQEQKVYAILTNTDGDDGWLELYNQQGENLGMGRTHLETVEWRGPEIRTEGGLPTDQESEEDYL